MAAAALLSPDRHRMARTQQAIHRGMIYWFCRMMLGWGSIRAEAAAKGISWERELLHHNCKTRAWRIKRTRALRALGFSGYALEAQHRGGTASSMREKDQKRHNVLKERHQGYPRLGNPAWIRREIEREEGQEYGKCSQ